MQLNKKTLDRLLSLDDQQLTAVIRSLAEGSGLSLEDFHIRPDDIKSIRTALSGATDEDLRRAGEQLQSFRRRQ